MKRLNRIIPSRSRREVLGFLGGTVAVSLVGCLRNPSASGESASAPANDFVARSAIAALPACIVKPQQTEGPYFVDDRLDRSDIRSDPTSGAVKPGVPLRLTFRVTRTDDRACTPLAGATVDVWHCDALGAYSDVADRNSTIGQKFLRGYQVTNADGIAQFTTIYPGWYPGRTVHIHFKIRSGSSTAQEFTSQLYFDDAVTDRVYAQAPYASRGQRTQRNAQDGIFSEGGDQLTLNLIPEAGGYRATFDIGLQFA